MEFDPIQLKTLVGGLNALDIPRLKIADKEQAKRFLRGYGFDLDCPMDLSSLWSFHRRATTYIQTEILRSGEMLPETLLRQDDIEDLTKIFIFASTKGHDLQSWSCGLLKVMHAFAHLDRDLFTSYSNEIQSQILKPIQSHIHEDPVMGNHLGPAMGVGSIGIRKFEIKPFKTTASSVTKLLAKPEIVAFSLMDKVGVRIITRHLVDVFRVMEYLLDQNIVCFAHMIPEQSNNTLYPLNLFIEVMEQLKRGDDTPSENIDRLLYKKLEEEFSRAEFKEKRNSFTSSDYRFIKFITRRLIKAKDSSLSFFYPFEVQIMDYNTYLNNTVGDASHDLYKERQICEVRERVFKLSPHGGKIVH